MCAHACRAGAERTAYVEDRHEHGEDGQTKDALHADGLQRRHVVLAQEALLHDELRGRKDLRAEDQRNAELIGGRGRTRIPRARTGTEERVSACGRLTRPGYDREGMRCSPGPCSQSRTPGSLRCRERTAGSSPAPSAPKTDVRPTAMTPRTTSAIDTQWNGYWRRLRKTTDKTPVKTTARHSGPRTRPLSAPRDAQTAVLGRAPYRQRRGASGTPTQRCRRARGS